MATNQRARAGSPQKGSKGRGGRSAPSPGPTARAGKSVKRAVGVAFDGRGHDVWGLVCIGLGLLVGLGVYLDVAGPLGGGIDASAGFLVGLLKFLAPPALVALGVILVRGERTVGPHPLRVAVGVVLATIGVAGLLHLSRGQPSLSADGVDDIGRAGGVLGAAMASPLDALMAPVASSVVLVVVAVLGVLVATGSSLGASVRRAGRYAAALSRPVRRSCGRFLSGLFHLGAAPVRDPDLHDGVNGAGATDQLATDEHVLVQLFDQDVDRQGDPAGAMAPGGAEPDTEARGRARRRAAIPPDETGTAEQLAITLDPASSRWKLPVPSLLKRSSVHEVDKAAVEQQGRTLERALAAHGVETRLVGMVVGPTVTRFELELGEGVKVARVTSLHKDIAYAMAAADVRILAPIPGRQAIGVEVPNVKRQIVTLGDILGSEEARTAGHPLEVAVGRDINGKAVMMNLATMPHLLIAGATGAGKSSCINSLITSILMRSSPDQVRLILVDPKRVELGQYNRLPHLLTQVVTNPKKAANALSWAVKEMERRYDVLSECGFRDIGGYNAAFDRGELGRIDPTDPESPEYPRLPYILVVVDELNDLMMVAARDVEESITRIAQMARAVGIHLVIATQRPSVNVITGVIKANIPSRLAFAVSSLADSRVILDQPGAERLVGRGDMLLLGSSSNVPHRIQGCWVSEDEVRQVVGAWRRQVTDLEYVDGIEGSDESLGGGSSSGGAGGEDDDDDLTWQAMELVVRHQLGSTSMLQRKLRVGFARAGRLMDLLEQRGVVGPSEGSKARAVLMTEQELDELLDQRA